MWLHKQLFEQEFHILYGSQRYVTFSYKENTNVTRMLALNLKQWRTNGSKMAHLAESSGCWSRYGGTGCSSTGYYLLLAVTYGLVQQCCLHLIYITWTMKPFYRVLYTLYCYLSGLCPLQDILNQNKMDVLQSSGEMYLFSWILRKD